MTMQWRRQSRACARAEPQPPLAPASSRLQALTQLQLRATPQLVLRQRAHGHAHLPVQLPACEQATLQRKLPREAQLLATAPEQVPALQARVQVPQLLQQQREPPAQARAREAQARAPARKPLPAPQQWM